MRSGAKVVSVIEPGAFEDIIDHEDFIIDRERNMGSSLSLRFDKNPLPLEAVFSFPLDKTVEIHQGGIQLTGSDFPDQVEFLVSEQGPEEGFRSLGTFQVEPEGGNYQTFPIEAVKAKYLKFRILSSSSEGRVKVSEIFVNGYFHGSERTAAEEVTQDIENGQILFSEDFSSGTLDRWQIWDDPEASNGPSHWAVVLSEFSGINNELNDTATALFTGEKSWNNYSIQTRMYAYQGDGYLNGLSQGIMAAHASGFHRKKDPFHFQRPPHFRYPRRKIHPGKGRDRHLGPGRGSHPSGQHQNHTVRARQAATHRAPGSFFGAAVIYRTSPPKEEPFRDLLDHSLSDQEHMGNTYDLEFGAGELPEEAVFCFPQGRFVEIHRIGFKLDHQHFPEEIKFWTSTQTPKSGFLPLATITPKPEKESYQEFDASPTKTKYLKVQITQGVDKRRIYLDDRRSGGMAQPKAWWVENLKACRKVPTPFVCWWNPSL